MISHRLVCPICEKEFPRWYWGVTGRAGGYGTVKKRGLATANFNRHVEACRRKKEMEGA